MRVTTLLVGSILLFMVGSTAGRTTRTPNASRPLSTADVEHGLKSAVPNARMAALVKKYGVDFELTDAVKEELRSAGASDNLILQIGRSRASLDNNSVRPTGHSAGTYAHRSTNTPRAHAQPSAKELLSQADKYRLGSGVVRNEAKAAQLYRKAAEMGNAEAETRFAEALFDGRGVAGEGSAPGQRSGRVRPWRDADKWFGYRSRSRERVGILSGCGPSRRWVCGGLFGSIRREWVDQ